MSALERKHTTQRATGTLALSEYTGGCVIDGKYRLIRKLGEGGMGSVWAAHSGPLDVSVALKVLRVDTAHDDSAERLLREARVMARLADPGIVRVFDVGQTDRGEPYIVMELLSGATLRQVLDSSRLDPVRAVRLLLPIVRALECAHRAGVVHRDVKPDNIVLAQGARGDLQPKLLDFGAAKLAQGVDNLTRVGLVVGSPLYMSPEQARGESVDHRTDLWSACVVLYEVVTGKPPFWGDNAHALLHAINTREVSTLHDSYEFDAPLWDIVRRGLTKDRDERWQTARDLMLELAAWLRAQGAMEDITGTALHGRGLGRYSSLPALEAGPKRKGKHAKARATAVVGANLGLESQPWPELEVAPAHAKRVRLFRVLSARYKTPLFWSGLGAALLVLVLLGIWAHRASEAAPPSRAELSSDPASTPVETLTQSQPSAPASVPAGGLAPMAPLSAEASLPVATPPAASRPAAARKAAAPRRETRKEKSLRLRDAKPNARARKPAFKDPFD